MNKLITSIVLSFLAFILAVNIYMWVSNPEYMNTDFFNLDYYVEPSRESFFGFRQFFEYLKTFPGLSFTYSMLSDFGNVVGNFNISNIFGIDLVLSIFRVLVVPMVAIATVCVDIFRNLMWFIGILMNH